MTETTCPCCAVKLNAARDPFDAAARPRQGDVSVCIGCGEVLVFTAELALRKPIFGEVEMACADREVAESLFRILRAVRNMRGPVV